MALSLRLSWSHTGGALSTGPKNRPRCPLAPSTGPSFGCRALVPLRRPGVLHRPGVCAVSAIRRARGSRRWWASTAPEPRAVCCALAPSTALPLLAFHRPGVPARVPHHSARASLRWRPPKGPKFAPRRVCRCAAFAPHRPELRLPPLHRARGSRRAVAAAAGVLHRPELRLPCPGGAFHRAADALHRPEVRAVPWCRCRAVAATTPEVCAAGALDRPRVRAPAPSAASELWLPRSGWLHRPGFRLPRPGAAALAFVAPPRPSFGCCYRCRWLYRAQGSRRLLAASPPAQGSRRAVSAAVLVSATGAGVAPRPGSSAAPLVDSPRPYCPHRARASAAARPVGLRGASGVAPWGHSPGPRFAPRPGASTGPSFGCRFLVPSTAPLMRSTRPRLGCCPMASTAPKLRLPRSGAFHRAAGGLHRPELRLLPWWPPPRPSFGCRAPVPFTALPVRSTGPSFGCRALVASTAPLMRATGPRLGCRFLAPLALLHRARASAAAPRWARASSAALVGPLCPGLLHRPGAWDRNAARPAQK